jgi:hypothetical protein
LEYGSADGPNMVTEFDSVLALPAETYSFLARPPLARRADTLQRRQPPKAITRPCADLMAIRLRRISAAASSAAQKQRRIELPKQFLAVPENCVTSVSYACDFRLPGQFRRNLPERHGRFSDRIPAGAVIGMMRNPGRDCCELQPGRLGSAPLLALRRNIRY